MPNLPWDVIIPLVIIDTAVAVLIGKIIRFSDKPRLPRPAVIAAAQRGLHQRYHRNDAE